jgi:hypothetical protein
LEDLGQLLVVLVALVQEVGEGDMRVVKVSQSDMLPHEVTQRDNLNGQLKIFLLMRATIGNQSLLHDLKVGGKCFVKKILQELLLLIVILALVAGHLQVPILFLQVRIGIQGRVHTPCLNWVLWVVLGCPVPLA